MHRSKRGASASKLAGRGLSAQGATEYLILLGVVMLIGLVVISLLDFSRAGTSLSSETQSEIYWKNVAQPIGITSVNANGPGKITMVVQNRKGQAISLTAISVDSHPVSPLLDGQPLPVTLPPGGVSVVTFNVPSFDCTSTSSLFSGALQFDYTLASGVQQTQTGDEPLVAACASTCGHYRDSCSTDDDCCYNTEGLICNLRHECSPLSS